MNQAYRPPTFGRCGDGTPHLPPQEGRVISYPQGPFAARLAPTLLQKQLMEVPPELQLGLLVTPPNADGDGYEEHAADDYLRERVVIGSFSREFDANEEPLSIKVAMGSLAKHVGLFDDDGRLRFYGFLSGYQSGSEPPRVFEFAACAMKLKKLAALATGPRPHLGGPPR